MWRAYQTKQIQGRLGYLDKIRSSKVHAVYPGAKNGNDKNKTDIDLDAKYIQLISIN